MSDEETFYVAIELFNQHRYTDVVSATKELLQKPISNVLRADTYYLQARALIECNLPSAAKKALVSSLKAGFNAIQHIKCEAPLEALHTPSEWAACLRKVRMNLADCSRVQREKFIQPSYPAVGPHDNSTSFTWLSMDDKYYKELLIHSELNGDFSDCLLAIRTIGRFVKTLWKHNPSRLSKVGTSLNILNEAFAGASFRCLEYALLFCDLISACGHRARVTYLMTADIDKPKLGQSHVVAEVYCIRERQWLMVDVQWGLLAKLNGHVISTRYFQSLLYAQSPVDYESFGDPIDSDMKQFYEYWIMPYLHYIAVFTDQKPIVPIETKTEMAILVPENISHLPQKFQGAHLPWRLLSVGVNLLYEPMLTNFNE